LHAARRVPVSSRIGGYEEYLRLIELFGALACGSGRRRGIMRFEFCIISEERLTMILMPNDVTGANAGGPRWSRMGTLWAARIAQFSRSA